MRLLVWNVYWGTYSPQTSGATCIYTPSLNMVENGQFFVLLQRVPGSIFTRVWSNQKFYFGAISGLELLNLYFTALTGFKSIHAALWVMNYFQPYNPFYTDETMVASCYSVIISMADVQVNYIFLVPPVQTFTARICHAIYTVNSSLLTLYSIGKGEVSLKQLLPQNCYMEQTPWKMLPW